MSRDLYARSDPNPDLQSVLDALDDPDCRDIIQHLTEPMTAKEISEACDIPMSTTYRKLERLSEATLVREGTELRADGHHATLYQVDFEDVTVGITEDRTLDVTVDRATSTADERLEAIWKEVRKQT